MQFSQCSASVSIALEKVVKTSKENSTTVFPRNGSIASACSVASSNLRTSNQFGIDTLNLSSSRPDQKTSRQSRRRQGKKSINIINWIYEMLCKKDPCIKWINQDSLTFRITQQHRLAGLWGIYKNNPKMNFNKFA